MRKIVLTGGASCGKTSVLEELKNKGFTVVTETATGVLREFAGKDFQTIQVEIFKRQLEKEKNAKGDLIFFDRSALDCLTYTRLFIDPWPEEVDESLIEHKYDEIFLLDKLPFVQNDVRIESGDEQAQEVHNELIKDYKKRGYSPVLVPVMDIEKRVEFILEKLSLK